MAGEARGLAGGLVLSLLSACTAPRSLPIPPELLPAAPGPPRDHRVVGWSVEARPIFAHLYGRGPETVVLVAGLHGHAPAGTHLLRQFMTCLETDRTGLLAGRRVVVIPCLNPDGRIHGTRFNARDVDLDRNFPAWSWRLCAHGGPRPASEPETTAFLTALEAFRPARVLLVMSPLDQVTYTGAARDLGRRVAEAIGYPFLAHPARTPPGALAACTGVDRRIPTVRIDLATRRKTRGLWREVHAGLDVFVRGE